MNCRAAGWSMTAALLVAVAVFISIPAYGASSMDAAMLRYPDVSATQIAFVYDNDIWVVPKEGGVAVPFSSPPGQEQFPKFSPDGTEIAFTANYDGNNDAYTMPVGGGTPRRLTYHPYSDRVIDYSPDGRVVFNSWREAGYPASKLFYADMEGGLPEALPLAYAYFASFSPNGKQLAFAPWTREWSTWKRYQGGTATDLWLLDLDTLEAERITDHPGTDDMPMFHGDWVYYLSDAGPAHRRNIWRYDTASGAREQVTKFTEFDIKWPSIGSTDIVFQCGDALYLLNLDDHSTHEVSVTIPGDHPSLRPRLVDVSDYRRGGAISPSAKRVAAEVRGDIWTIPAEEGFKRNLSRSDGVAERSPAWSPDGKWVCYFSDRSGEYQLCIIAADGSGEERQLTGGNPAFYYNPVWSPDSGKIAFNDQTGRIWIHLVEGEETILVDKDPWADYWRAATWAPDSNWLAYTISDEDTSNSVVKLYDLENRSSHQVTSAMFASSEPAFDLSGDFLYFATDRQFDPSFSPVGEWGEFFFTDTTVIACVALRSEVEWPFAPQNDEEELDAEEGDDGENDDGEEDAEGGGEEETDEAATTADGAEAEDGAAEEDIDDTDDEQAEEEEGEDEEEEPERLEIELEGLEQRARLLPIEAGRYYGLSAGENKLFYLKRAHGAGWGESSLLMFDLGEEEEQSVLEGVSGYQLTPDAAKALVSMGGQLYIIDAAPGAAPEQPIDTGGMLAQIDPGHEWEQIVRDVWRIYRDFFYDPNMHGVDWDAQLTRGLRLVQHAANRDDVYYIIGLMIAELNVGHAYVAAWSEDQGERRPVGLLGCDFDLARDEDSNQGYRIARIYDTADWDLEVNAPLRAPGVDVEEGDFLLAVNGIPLDTSVSPYAALVGTAERPTSLTVSTKAVLDEDAREVLVEPIPDEYELRHRAWMEHNRQYVLDQSDGRLGYIYVRNTSWEGFSDFMRQFSGQFRRDGLIVDERWNGGGLSPHRMVEILAREVLQYWATRDGASWRTPQMLNTGPKAMLINHAAGSGGDSFPYVFRRMGVGPLIGTRTWGGLVGLSGNPGLIDGGYVSVPTFGFFEADGTWAVEGYGVAPDIEVVDDPGLLARGQDPQLDAAIEYLLGELEKNPPVEVVKPPYPDRSGMGVPEEDW